MLPRLQMHESIEALVRSVMRLLCSMCGKNQHTHVMQGPYSRLVQEIRPGRLQLTSSKAKQNTSACRSFSQCTHCMQRMALHFLRWIEMECTARESSVLHCTATSQE